MKKDKNMARISLSRITGGEGLCLAGGKARSAVTRPGWEAFQRFSLRTLLILSQSIRGSQ